MGNDVVYFLENHHGQRDEALQFKRIGGKEPFTNNVVLCKRLQYPNEDVYTKGLRLRLAQNVQRFANDVLMIMKKPLGRAMDDIAGGPSKPINGESKTDLVKMIRAVHRLLNKRVQERLQKDETQYEHFQHLSQRPFWTLDICRIAYLALPLVQDDIFKHLSKKRLIPSTRIRRRLKNG